MRFKERLANIGFETYKDYLKSAHWQAFKQGYKESGRPQRCMACDAKRVSLHHITYERLGEEVFTDVVPLCRKHHREPHEILKEMGWPVHLTTRVLDLIGGNGLRSRKRQKGKKKSKRRNARVFRACSSCRKNPTKKNKALCGACERGGSERKHAFTGVCRNCKKPDIIRCWWRASGARCAGCGGIMDPVRPSRRA